MNNLWDKIMKIIKQQENVQCIQRKKITGYVKKTKECIIYGQHIMQL